jgi:site-specific recombinase XerD
MEGELILRLLTKHGITPGRILLNEREHFTFQFEHDERVIRKLKAISGSRWSKTAENWVMPAKRILLEKFVLNLEKSDDTEFLIPDWMNDYMRQMKLRGYSSSTLTCYRNMILLFFKFFKGRDIRSLKKEDIEIWLEYLLTHRNYSSSALNQAVNAVKFLYEKVWDNIKAVYRLPRARKEIRLPKVLHQTEIERIFSAVNNPKHKVILYTTYAAGLRVSEVVNLRLKDIRSDRKEIFIEQAKGKKDRVVMLPDKLLKLLREYYLEYKPKTWLFEGQYGEKYSTRSVQVIFSRAKHAAGVTLKGGPHLLRHSFATHLLESGIDISIIKELLGHNSLKTTLTYTHVSNRTIKNIVSPLDKLNL